MLVTGQETRKIIFLHAELSTSTSQSVSPASAHECTARGERKRGGVAEMASAARTKGLLIPSLQSLKRTIVIHSWREEERRSRKRTYSMSFCSFSSQRLG